MSDHPAPSGHTDPEGEAPWAMQIVVRDERDTTPGISTMCAAVASAVAATICDPRRIDDPAWAAAFDRWTAGRIRKIVRRARGSAWTKVCAADGAAHRVGGVEVFVAVPSPTDAVPAAIRRTQVSGHTVDADERPRSVTVPEAGIVVAVNPEWELHHHPGKLAAQAAHAAQIAYAEMDEVTRRRWADAGFAVVLEWPDPDDWAQLEAASPVVITDAGFTVLPRPGQTVAARWR